MRMRETVETQNDITAASVIVVHKPINANQKQLQTIIHSCQPSDFYCLVSGLLTVFGLEFLARKLSGPNIDGATLQLVGLLFASTLLPGLAHVAQRNE
eukprot:4545539-Amphidinium_carterae.1